MAAINASKYSASARGMSASLANSDTRSCHSQLLSCQRYSACSASLRATVRAPELRSKRPLTTLVERVGRRAFQRLRARIHGQDPETDRYTGVEHHALQAVGALAGDEFEMRGIAADHASQRHH